MVISEDCKKMHWSSIGKGKVVKNVVYSQAFSKDAQMLVKIYASLFKLLRIVDADMIPYMDFVYGILEDTKTEIRNVCNKETIWGAND